MAGDPIYGETTITRTGRWYDTTTPTDWDESNIATVGYTYSTNVIRENREEEKEKKNKELLRKNVIKDMKDKWSDFQLMIKPPPVRPIIQLRGVCFGGRGWA